jgi:hypothetical protein
LFSLQWRQMPKAQGSILFIGALFVATCAQVRASTPPTGPCGKQKSPQKKQTRGNRVVKPRGFGLLHGGWKKGVDATVQPERLGCVSVGDMVATAELHTMAPPGASLKDSWRCVSAGQQATRWRGYASSRARHSDLRKRGDARIELVLNELEKVGDARRDVAGAVDDIVAKVRVKRERLARLICQPRQALHLGGDGQVSGRLNKAGAHDGVQDKAVG